MIDASRDIAVDRVTGIGPAQSAWKSEAECRACAFPRASRTMSRLALPAVQAGTAGGWSLQRQLDRSRPVVRTPGETVDKH